jgi:small conductance mechanosensitive channel
LHTLFRVLAHVRRDDYSAIKPSQCCQGGLHAYRLFQRLEHWRQDHQRNKSLLPNILLALLIFFAFLLLGAAGKSLARRWVQRQRKHQGIALLMARLVQTSILTLGFLIALSVVAPSFKAGDLIKLLGVGTVAIGFAFQNILQNFLAGILLLLQEPFRLGDFISVTGIEGTVHDIQSRATIVSTKDGRRVVIPNAVLFTSPVAIESASAKA